MASKPKPTGDTMKTHLDDLMEELEFANAELEKLKQVSVRTPIGYLQHGIAALAHINRALATGAKMQVIVLSHNRNRNGLISPAGEAIHHD
jgi:hypothetical protein